MGLGLVLGLGLGSGVRVRFGGVRCMPWEEGSGAGAMLWCWWGSASMSRDASALDAWLGVGVRVG